MKRQSLIISTLLVTSILSTGCNKIDAIKENDNSTAYEQAKEVNNEVTEQPEQENTTDTIDDDYNKYNLDEKESYSEDEETDEYTEEDTDEDTNNIDKTDILYINSDDDLDEISEKLEPRYKLEYSDLINGIEHVDSLPDDKYGYTTIKNDDGPLYFRIETPHKIYQEILGLFKIANDNKIYDKFEYQLSHSGIDGTDLMLYVDAGKVEYINGNAQVYSFDLEGKTGYVIKSKHETDDSISEIRIYQILPFDDIDNYMTIEKTYINSGVSADSIDDLDMLKEMLFKPIN